MICSKSDYITWNKSEIGSYFQNKTILYISKTSIISISIRSEHWSDVKSERFETDYTLVISLGGGAAKLCLVTGT